MWAQAKMHIKKGVRSSKKIQFYNYTLERRNDLEVKLNCYYYNKYKNDCIAYDFFYIKFHDLCVNDE